jgi:hypothetical protein
MMESAPNGFWMWMSRLNAGDLAGLLFLTVVAVVAIIAIVATATYKIHRSRLEDALKRELLDRGMTADEIATVIQATPVRGGTKSARL